MSVAITLAALLITLYGFWTRGQGFFGHHVPRLSSVAACGIGPALFLVAAHPEHWHAALGVAIVGAVGASLGHGEWQRMGAGYGLFGPQRNWARWLIGAGRISPMGDDTLSCLIGMALSGLVALAPLAIIAAWIDPALALTALAAALLKPVCYLANRWGGPAFGPVDLGGLPDTKLGEGLHAVSIAILLAIVVLEHG